MVAKQMKIQMRGFSLCDDDWRAYPLRNLHILGEQEELMLARLESEEPMTDYEYTRINQDLDMVIAETKRILDFYVKPVVYRWWTTENGRRFI